MAKHVISNALLYPGIGDNGRNWIGLSRPNTTIGWQYENGNKFTGSFADNIDESGQGEYPWLTGQPGALYQSQEQRVYLGPGM